MRQRISLVALFGGLALVAVAVAMMLWPLHGNGLGGNALRPNYLSGGWVAYAPLQDGEVGTEQLRAILRAESEPIVDERRRQAGSVAGVGALLGVLGAASVRRGVAAT